MQCLHILTHVVFHTHMPTYYSKLELNTGARQNQPVFLHSTLEAEIKESNLQIESHNDFKGY